MCATPFPSDTPAYDSYDLNQLGVLGRASDPSSDEVCALLGSKITVGQRVRLGLGAHAPS